MRSFKISMRLTKKFPGPTTTSDYFRCHWKESCRLSPSHSFSQRRYMRDMVLAVPYIHLKGFIKNIYAAFRMDEFSLEVFSFHGAQQQYPPFLQTFEKTEKSPIHIRVSFPHFTLSPYKRYHILVRVQRMLICANHLCVKKYI